MTYKYICKKCSTSCEVFIDSQSVPRYCLYSQNEYPSWKKGKKEEKSCATCRFAYENNETGKYCRKGCSNDREYWRPIICDKVSDEGEKLHKKAIKHMQEKIAEDHEKFNEDEPKPKLPSRLVTIGEFNIYEIAKKVNQIIKYLEERE